jgi:hypothetical protein
MSAPDHIIALAQERTIARTAKDWSRSDQLRDEIAAAGFDVVDVAGGFELRERERYPVYSSPRDIRPIVVGPSEIAIAMIVEGFTDDCVATVRTIKEHCQTPIVLLVLGDPGALVDQLDHRTKIIALSESFGWGECANALLKNIAARFVVIMDPSTRFSGDAISPVLEVLAQGKYIAVGWRGGLINLDDQWRSVDDKGAGDVDVLFSYFIAVDREGAINSEGFNNRALYYRNADIEFSLRLKHAGGDLLQMDLPLEQARHHGYYDVDPEYRELQSKKNYDRILERFRDKEAILSPRR